MDHELGAFIVGLAMGFIIGNAGSARSEEKPEGSILLPFSGQHARLEDCDRAWKAEGKARPPYAVVVNQTMCEPRQQCQYGGQVYLRTCYRRQGGGPARAK